MNATDGSFSSPIENVNASWDSRTVPNGEHTIYVHGKDAADNWGALKFITVNVNNAPGDTTAPASIETLSAAVGTNTGDVNLSWTAVADDGADPASGPATSYIIYYQFSDTKPADTSGASTYTPTPTPGMPGGTESMVMHLTAANAGKKVWVMIEARDEVPNTSLPGNWAVTIVKNFVPAPIIDKIYPNKGPNDRVNHIVIEGQNLFNNMIAKIGNTDLLNVHQDSDTMVQADVPSGVTPGNYEISITCPGGTYDDAAHANPNNNFTVFDSNVNPDTVSPEVVTNFNASDGEDGQSTLTWTNPASGDLREVIVLRKEGSYPTNHSDAAAVKAFGTLIPEPGAAVNYVDTGLTNTITYNYAVFSRDTSDNWNDTVDSTVPNVNADTGTPSTGGANPPITLIFDPTRGNIFWVSVPYNNPDTTASAEIASINIQNGLPADSGQIITSIGRWKGTANPQEYESYDYLQGLGWSGIDFNIVKGESIYLNVASTGTFTLEGTHDPNFVFNLPYDATRGNIFWISLPYRGDYTDAVSIIADINASAGLPANSGDLVTSIGRWNGTANPQVYESYDYLQGLGWSGTPFTFTATEGYYINITGNVNAWKPKVH